MASSRRTACAPPIQIEHFLTFGNMTTVTIRENGRFVISYTTWAPYSEATALAMYRKAKKLYGFKPSLPFKD